MNRPVITQVSRRSTQGVTEPFLCLADDGKWYWCKGHGAGRHSLCAEWLAGRIAQDLLLPIPPFCQLVVPKELVSDSLLPEICDLGAGIAFGSADVANTRDYQFGDIHDTLQTLRAGILFFDWLIQNDDRTLGPEGGNPNLRWSIVEKRLWVIDHNVAFDNDFSPEEFFASHVFAADKPWLVANGLLDFRARMADITGRVESIVGEIPEEWLFQDREMTQPVGFVPAARALLARKAQSLEPEWGIKV